MPPDYESMNTGLLLYLPYRYLEEEVLASLRAKGHSITVSQARVFQRIGREGSRLADLTAATSLTKQSVGFLVDQLEAAGYVTRAPDPRDARARIVSLTPLGHEAVEQSAEIVARVERQWAEVLGADELAHLRRALARLSAHSDRHADPA